MPALPLPEDDDQGQEPLIRQRLQQRFQQAAPQNFAESQAPQADRAALQPSPEPQPMMARGPTDLAPMASRGGGLADMASRGGGGALADMTSRGGAAGGGGPFDREGFRDAWMSTGSDAARQNALLQQHGLTPDAAGRVRLPTGETIDLRLGARAGGTQATWTGVAGGESKPGQAGFGGGGPLGGPGGGPGGGGGAGGPQDFQGQLRARLLEQLTNLSKPISADDPTIAGELQAQERGLERNRQDRRAAMAERAAAQGLLSGGASSGAFDADLASGFEDKGQAMSGLRSQLFGRELQNRRGQLANMLGMALQSGDAEAARALQLQLGQMDNELRRLGLSEQARQFNDQFGLEGARFRAQQDRDLALFGAGG